MIFQNTKTVLDTPARPLSRGLIRLTHMNLFVAISNAECLNRFLIY